MTLYIIRTDNDTLTATTIKASTKPCDCEPDSSSESVKKDHDQAKEYHTVRSRIAGCLVSLWWGIFIT